MQDTDTNTKTKKRDVFRVGDTVKIINTSFFLRCGYPLSIDEIREEIRGKYANEVESFIKKIVNESTNKKEDDYLSVVISNAKNDRITEDIIREIAYRVLRHRGYGGTTRSVHVIDIPELKNREFMVIQKRVCYSGTYNSGYSSSGYGWDDGDACPPYLGNTKAHVILTLSESFELHPYINNGSYWSGKIVDGSYMQKLNIHGKQYPLAIEACNVEKVNKE